MAWFSAKELQQHLDVRGVEITPRTLERWVKAGTLRKWQPGGKGSKILYQITDSADVPAANATTEQQMESALLG